VKQQKISESFYDSNDAFDLVKSKLHQSKLVIKQLKSELMAAKTITIGQTKALKKIEIEGEH